MIVIACVLDFEKENGYGSRELLHGRKYTKLYLDDC